MLTDKERHALSMLLGQLDPDPGQLGGDGELIGDCLQTLGCLDGQASFHRLAVRLARELLERQGQ